MGRMMDRCKCLDITFDTSHDDELESGGDDEVCKEWVVDFIYGREGFSKSIEHGIQLWKAKGIAPLKVNVRCRVLRRGIIDIQESPVEECPEFCPAGFLKKC